MTSTSTRLAGKAGMLGLNLLLASGIGMAETAPTSAGYAPPLGSNGSGSGGVFSFSATDPDGAADIKTLIVVTNSVFSGWGGCYFFYDQPSNMIYLSSASGTSETWSSLVVGSSDSKQNPYCTIHGDQGTQVILSGNTLTLKVYITFNSSWTGLKYFYLMPIDTVGGYGICQQV